MLLVIEDDPLVARMIWRRVSTRIATSLASTVAEAESLTNDITQWCSFMVDIGLPEGPNAGIEFARRLRERAPHVPVALISGTLERGMLDAAVELEATAICKPIELDHLDAFLKRVHRASDPLGDYAKSVGLTPREAELFRWIGEGRAASDYLATHNMARSTLNSHAKAIRKKTGASSLVALALEVLNKIARGQA